jgi:hypothetical protein
VLDDGGSGSSPRADPVFTANDTPSECLRFPASLLSSFSSFSGERAVWTCDEPQRRLGLGTLGGVMAAYLYQRPGLDTWMAKKQRRARGHIATALPRGVAAPGASGVTKGKGGRMTTTTSSRHHHGSQLSGARRGRGLTGRTWVGRR